MLRRFLSFPLDKLKRLYGQNNGRKNLNRLQAFWSFNNLSLFW